MVILVLLLDPTLYIGVTILLFLCMHASHTKIFISLFSNVLMDLIVPIYVTVVCLHLNQYPMNV